MPDLTIEQRYIILILIFMLISGLFYGAYSRFIKPSDSEIFVCDSSESPISPKAILVHVSGAVRKQGVFKLEEGSRIIDAIKTAGGLVPDSDLSEINLAKIAQDGEKIVIPFARESSLSEIISSSDNHKNGLINVNSASKEQLMAIPGIGQVMADRIVEYRGTNGLFSDIDQLKKVPGVGEKKLTKMKQYITVN